MHTKYNAQTDVWRKKLNIQQLNYGHSYKTCTSIAQFLNQSARTRNTMHKLTHGKKKKKKYGN